MNRNDTDAHWESWGKNDPYWAVLTDDRFKGPNLDAAGRADFFSSGEAYIDWVFATIRATLSADFAPKRALDFGCGVGRLLMPLAKRCDLAVGIDVSESMLREARAVCEAEKITNVTLLKASDGLTDVAGQFDLINSYIVFQHIPCYRGLELFGRLVDSVGSDGFGALHFTYSEGAYGCSATDLPNCFSWPNEDGFWHHLFGLRRAFRRRVTRGWFQLKSPRRFPRQKAKKQHSAVDASAMQMNAYALNPIFVYLQQAGVRELHVAFSDHGGTLGTTLFFQKRVGSTYLLPALFERTSDSLRSPPGL